MFKALNNRAAYLLWAGSHWSTKPQSCPFCETLNVSVVKRKYVVTALYTCNQCGLLFRVPKDDPSDAEAFYDKDYSQGFTTDCPSDMVLQELKANKFKNSEKDYNDYIHVLQATGLQPGQSILDFGCSWGYGSWQLTQAGYEVYSYDISKPRARYASEKMGCKVIDNLSELPGKVDCFFSAHVIEHLVTPSEFWEAASRSINSNGSIIAFTPNGDLTRKGIHQNWGKVHPILLTPSAFQFMATRYKINGNCYTRLGHEPYDLNAIANRQPETRTGDELLFIGYPNRL